MEKQSSNKFTNTNETPDPMATAALETLQSVFSRLPNNREQRAMFARLIRVTENLFQHAAPKLVMTPAMKAADDVEFLVEVIIDSISQYPHASKKDMLRLKGQAVFRKQIEDAGGVYSSQEVADLLGINPDAVRKRRNNGRLIAITKGKHHVYPTFQFDNNGVVAQLPEVLATLKADSPVDAVQFFLTTDDSLKYSPIEALKQDKKIDLVFRLAKQFRRHVAR